MARPTALKAASATWWALRPVAVTCRVIRAVWASDSKRVRGHPRVGLDVDAWRSPGPRGRPRRGPAPRPWARAPRRSGPVPRRSPSASSRASPKARIMSSTVWWSPVSRSPTPSRRRSSPAWNAQLGEHVVVEALAGADVDPTLARDAQAHVEQRLGGRASQAPIRLGRAPRRAARRAARRAGRRCRVRRVRSRAGRPRRRAAPRRRATAARRRTRRSPSGCRGSWCTTGAAPARARRVRATSRSRSAIWARDVRLGRQRGEREGGRQRRDRQRRLARGDHLDHLGSAPARSRRARRRGRRPWRTCAGRWRPTSTRSSASTPAYWA